MKAAGGPGLRPKLGVVYESGSIPVLDLVGAVGGRWSIVWIVHEQLEATEQAPLRRFGELVELVDVALPAAVARLREVGVAGITTFADRGLRYAAELATELGILGNSVETAVRLTDKVAQRDALGAAGLPTPAFCRLPADVSESTLRATVEAVPFPVVIKPAVGSGGRDTTSAGDFGELTVELNRRWSAGDCRTLIIEQCMGAFPPQPIDGFGDYASVEVVVVDGSVQVLGLTGRMPLAEPFRETGSFAPSNLSREEADALCEAATTAVRALGVEVGCLHVEMKRTTDGPRVIEVNGRVPGGGIPDLLQSATGTDLYAAAVSSAMGEPVMPARMDSDSVSYAFALQPPLAQPTRLRDDWQARLAAIPGVRRVEVRAESANVQPEDGSYGYLLMVSGEVADHEALHGLQAQLNALIEPDTDFQTP
jgi:biotin carboxylase